MTETATGARTMGKTQKNALLDDGLCDVIDYLQKLTGATFPRIVTAAILKYLFEVFHIPAATDSTSPPDPTWMRLAVDIERGDFTLGEVPGHLSERAIERADEWIAHYRREKQTDVSKHHAADWVVTRNSMVDLRRRWCESVDHYGSERAAIRQYLETRLAGARS